MTTFKLGGPAEFFCAPKTKDELIAAFVWALDNKQEVLILGGCSNVVISDEGVKGLVIKIANNNLSVHGKRINCGAGVSLAFLATTSFGNNFSGLEWTVGIPGATLGGSIRGNAGAFGCQIEDSIETVEAYDVRKKIFVRLSRHDCEFKYRGSIFKDNPELIIWEAILQFSSLSRFEIQEQIDECLKKRFKNQPKLPSAGCVFKNLTATQLTRCNKKLSGLAKKENLIKGGKVGAGWVIEQAGWKGNRQGGVKVSLEHANFIVNIGKGTAGDVRVLASRIKKDVYLKFGIILREEVEFVGF